MRRRVKGERQLAGIRAAQLATEAAFARAVEVLGASSPGSEGLVFEGETLTWVTAGTVGFAAPVPLVAGPLGPPLPPPPPPPQPTRQAASRAARAINRDRFMALYLIRDLE